LTKNNYLINIDIHGVIDIILASDNGGSNDDEIYLDDSISPLLSLSHHPAFLSLPGRSRHSVRTSSKHSWNFRVD